MGRNIVFGIGVLISIIGLSNASPAGAADAKRGAQLFQSCAACHSLETDRNLTGPSLANLWGRKAGSLASFHRYSSALRKSGVVWGDETLDRWLAGPRAFIPGNLMPFPGINAARDRQDLIAYLKATTAPGAQPPRAAQPGQGMGGMSGGQGKVHDLKKLEPDEKVIAIAYCGDTYRVTTADGNIDPIWEFNLRFKTDSSKLGPEKGIPAYISAGMMGDRGFVVFSDPLEISAFIRKSC